MSYRYSRQSSKGIEQAIKAVEEQLALRKFSVLWHLDMSRTLESKGFPGHQEFHVLEVCNAGRANEVMSQNRDVGYMLPCRIVVAAKDGGTEIGVLRPQILIDLVGDANLRGIAEEVEGDLRAAVDASC